MEHHLPMLHILAPQSLLRRFPSVRASLHVNQQRFVTRYMHRLFILVCAHVQHVSWMMSVNVHVVGRIMSLYSFERLLLMCMCVSTSCAFIASVFSWNIALNKLIFSFWCFHLSSFDIYNSLLHLIKLNEPAVCPKHVRFSRSIFEPIARNRTCTDANIPSTRCICQ